MYVNVQQRLIGFKIVYYGPAMGGKTSNVRHIARVAERVSGDLLSLATRGERTLYFDMLHLSFGDLGGYKTYFNLYTTPGQTVYMASRRLVLQGADAIVFVMDSQQTRLRDNVQSWYSMERQLLELNTSKYKLPIIIQLNKRDMPYIAPAAQLLGSIHAETLPYIEANAEQGLGVFATLDWVIKSLIEKASAEFQANRALDSAVET
ncbi:MAG: GTPase domain-containing protein [Chloroflexi bacterium]|nr:GTPase domain-containing protein [Chloroflexota bacterium]